MSGAAARWRAGELCAHKVSNSVPGSGRLPPSVCRAALRGWLLPEALITALLGVCLGCLFRVSEPPEHTLRDGRWTFFGAYLPQILRLLRNHYTGQQNFYFLNFID